MSTYTLELATVNTGNEPIVDSSDRVLILGTCFASALTNYFSDIGIESAKIPAANQIYSPEAVSIFLDFCASDAMNLDDYTAYDKHADGIRFLPFGISAGLFDDRAGLEASLATEMSSYRHELCQADVVVIFLGTTRVIRTIDGGKLINKVDGFAREHWDSEHMSTPEIIRSLHNTIERIRQLNPKAKIIFAIDPQRYLFAFVEDRISDNFLSKALLLQGLHEVLKEHTGVYYFKVLEIVLEELRHCEYINASNLIHVNNLTISHVFKRFADSFFNARSLAAFSCAEALLNRIVQLRPFENALEIAEAQKRILNKVLDSLCAEELSLLVAPDSHFKTIRRVAEACGHEAVLHKLHETYLARYPFLQSGETFYVWGTGGRVAHTIAQFVENNDRCLGFIDNNVAKQGITLFGKPVHAPEILSQSRPDLVVVASTFYQEISLQIGVNWPGLKVRHIGSHL